MWVIEKVVSKGDYKYALVPTHPNSTNNGYVLEHRIIAENHLGRLLKKNEIVHHVNENKMDNRRKNLRVMTASSHATVHAFQEGGRCGLFKCQLCGTEFEHTASKYLRKIAYYLSCSDACSRKLRSAVRKGRLNRHTLRKNNLIQLFDLDESSLEMKLPKKLAPGNWQLKYEVKSKRVERHFKPKLRVKCAWCSKIVIDAKKRKYCSWECNLAGKHASFNKPSKSKLRSDLKRYRYSELSRQYSVSHTTVRRWAQEYNLI